MRKAFILVPLAVALFSASMASALATPQGRRLSRGEMMALFGGDILGACCGVCDPCALQLQWLTQDCDDPNRFSVEFCQYAAYLDGNTQCCKAMSPQSPAYRCQNMGQQDHMCLHVITCEWVPAPGFCRVLQPPTSEHIGFNYHQCVENTDCGSSPGPP
jgi:hypothetical protein